MACKLVHFNHYVLNLFLTIEDKVIMISTCGFKKSKMQKKNRFYRTGGSAKFVTQVSELLFVNTVKKYLGCIVHCSFSANNNSETCVTEFPDRPVL